MRSTASSGRAHVSTWADVETVVDSETDVQEHGLGREALDGIQCGRGTAGLPRHGVTAPLQQQPSCFSEIGLVVDDRCALPQAQSE